MCFKFTLEKIECFYLENKITYIIFFYTSTLIYALYYNFINVLKI